MTAYIIARVEIRHTAWTEAYVPKTMALIQKYGGKVLVGSGSAMEALEGEGKLPSAIIVVEFPSMAQAKDWYHDPRYAPMITLRQTGADTDEEAQALVRFVQGPHGNDGIRLTAPNGCGGQSNTARNRSPPC